MFGFINRVGLACQALLMIFACLHTSSASGQQVTQEQRNALRNNCRSDFMAKCSSVQPGGIEALQCLQQHLPTLSSGCQQAVHALGPAPQPATAPAPQQSAAPAAPAAAPARPSSAAQQTERTPAPARASKTAASPQPSPVAQACRSDLAKHCRGSASPAAAKACLQQNAERLSPSCARALVAAAPAAAPVAPAPAAPTAEAQPQRGLGGGPIRRAIRERMRERAMEQQ